jgi:protein O-GlcNAc transferase
LAGIWRNVSKKDNFRQGENYSPNGGMLGCPFCSPSISPMSAHLAALPKQVIGSRQVTDWLQSHQISLACTTYQTSRLLLLGLNAAGQLSGFERIFDRAMGLHATAERLYLSTKYQLWQLDNALQPGQQHQGYDRLYIPRVGYTTGDLDIHDVVALPDGRVVFVCTVLNCLATLSDRHSCQPIWKPPFISQITNEDRCHLNGLAMVKDQPRYVTAVSQSDMVDGWRDRRQDGGVIIDILSNQIVVSGLSMPHSPRWYGDRLWVLNSGRGEFGYVDLAAGRFEPVTFCPGYLRGMAFWQDWAIVGLSKSRKEDHTFGGLALDGLLVEKDVEARCGLMVINLKTGNVDHWLRIEGGLITELYDVQVLPGVQHPMALGFQTEEIAQLITLQPMASLQEKQSPAPTVGEKIRGQLGVWTGLATLALCSRIAQGEQERTTAQDFFEQSQVCKRQQDWQQAEICLREALRLQPDFWGAYNNLGTLLQQQGDWTAAEECYGQALRFNPNFAEAIANRASIWQLRGELERAKPEFLRALQLKPDYLPAHLNLAHLYKQQGRLGGAVDHFRRVIELDATRIEAYFQLGQILEYQDDPEGALAYYRRALEIDPTADYIQPYIELIGLRQCDWQDYEQKLQVLTHALESSVSGRSDHRFNPFLASCLPVSLDLHRSIAQTHAQMIEAENKPRLSAMTVRRSPDRRLRIGYLSPDFRDHAVGRLIYQIFRQHDRQKYEIYAYTTVDTYDQITEQVEQGCDRFMNLGLMTTRQAAQQIRDDEIDILIDLAGYTIGNGAPILALQPAPIQAQFLGYPDTMGASFIQYAIVDDWLVTPEIEASYTEQIIRLPHAFVGSSLMMSDRLFTRADFGLPETGFVFCCFNTHHKITPEVFDAWTEILKQVPDSVLWLLGRDDQVQVNLRTEAKIRGIEGDRLLFSQRLSYAEYLAKYQFADLFLDTFLYSAGSTAVAAIWGGTPMITRPGKTNASRMGASICAAAGLEQLICASTEEYVNQAVHLATHPDELTAIRSRLIAKRETLPLFDVAGFTRSLEGAFEHMVLK